MTISPKVKVFFVITAKHLVLAAFTDVVLWAGFPKEFELHDWRGAAHIVLTGAAQILGKEFLQVWMPAILVWAKTETSPPG